MPCQLTLTSSLRVKSEDSSTSLSLNCKHYLNLLSTEPSSKSIRLTSALPSTVEVYPPSSGTLALSITGCVDGACISSQKIIKSAVAHRLRNFTASISENLGLSFVTCLYIDEDDDIVKFSINIKNSQSITKYPAHVSLSSLKLTIDWKTQDDALAQDPFSHRDFEPYEDLFMHIIRKFVTVHMARRYPLVFGHWRQKLVIESKFFSSISRSILAMGRRSQNEEFRDATSDFLEKLEELHQRANSSCIKELNKRLTVSNPDTFNYSSVDDNLTQEEVLCIALERLFKSGTRPPPLKIVPTFIADAEQSDDRQDCEKDEAEGGLEWASDDDICEGRRLVDMEDASPNLLDLEELDEDEGDDIDSGDELCALSDVEMLWADETGSPSYNASSETNALIPDPPHMKLTDGEYFANDDLWLDEDTLLESLHFSSQSDSSLQTDEDSHEEDCIQDFISFEKECEDRYLDDMNAKGLGGGLEHHSPFLIPRYFKLADSLNDIFPSDFQELMDSDEDCS